MSDLWEKRQSLKLLGIVKKDKTGSHFPHGHRQYPESQGRLEKNDVVGSLRPTPTPGNLVCRNGAGRQDKRCIATCTRVPMHKPAP